MTDFTLTKESDGIATITWDVADKSMNVMSFEGLESLNAHVDDALADDAVKGIVITSGKDSFAGGMDLNLLAKMKEDAGDNPAKGLFEGVMKMHALLRKIELAGMDPKTQKGGKPIAAALPGTAAGIGWNCRWPRTAIFMRQQPQGQDGPAGDHGGHLSPAPAAPRDWCANWARWAPRRFLLGGQDGRPGQGQGGG